MTISPAPCCFSFFSCIGGFTYCLSPDRCQLAVQTQIAFCRPNVVATCCQRHACHEFLLGMQLLEFLRAALSHEQYASLLPEPHHMMEVFGLDATTVLTLHRPLLSRVQPPLGKGSEEEDGEIDTPQVTETDMSSSSEALSTDTAIDKTRSQLCLEVVSPLSSVSYYAELHKTPTDFSPCLLGCQYLTCESSKT